MAPRNPRGLFSERKVHAFRGISALGNDDEKPEEQRAMFLSRPRATNGKISLNLHAEKTFFRANSDSKCSACRSGLFTYILPPCTPSPLTSLRPPRPWYPSCPRRPRGCSDILFFLFYSSSPLPGTEAYQHNYIYSFYKRSYCIGITSIQY
jgi:hypothetical protein